MGTKTTDDDDPPPFEIGSPLERQAPIELPGPPRRKLGDHDKTPRVEHVDRIGKRSAELHAMLDQAEGEVARLRQVVEDDIEAFVDAAASLEHEGDEADETCSEGPDDCTRCALEAAARDAREALAARG